jgi:hypothetical protein
VGTLPRGVLGSVLSGNVLLGNVEPLPR